VAAELRHAEAAEALYELLEPWGDHIPTASITIWLPTAHYLGLLAASLGRRESADAHFARAVEIAEGFRAPLLAAWSRLAWGRSLIESEDPAEAARGRELLTEAQAAGRQLGVPRVEGRAEALLASAAPS
jgi:sugar phosphate isomerase/epimerase